MLRINCDLKTLEKIHDNIVTANIHLELNGKQFPEKNWKDSPALLLVCWLDEIELMELSDDGEFRFVEGAFHFTITHDKSCFYMTAFQNEMQVWKEKINFRQFKNTVIFTASQVLAEIEMNGWAGREVDALSRKLNIALISGESPQSDGLELLF